MMKKILIIFILISICGCSNTAIQSVYDYFSLYKNMSLNVQKSIDRAVEYENLNMENSAIYKRTYERLYRNLKYNIISESYNNANAIVRVEIETYDLGKCEKEALNSWQTMEDSEIYNIDEYQNYKLNAMLNCEYRTTSELDINLYKKKGKWYVEELSINDIDKINGISNLDF